MKTSRNTPPRHTTCVQFNGALVQQRYIKTKSRPVCKCFPHTEIPLTQWKYFCQSKLHVIWDLQPVHFLVFVTYIY